MLTLLFALALQDAPFKDKPDVAAAQAKAAKEYRRVLIVWGRNDSKESTALAALMKKNVLVARKLSYEYDVVWADAAGRDEIKAVPTLKVLAADGKELASETVEGEADPKTLIAFLEKNQAPPQNAKELYDAALRQAKESKRTLFLTFGAPW